MPSIYDTDYVYRWPLSGVVWCGVVWCGEECSNPHQPGNCDLRLYGDAQAVKPDAVKGYIYREAVGIGTAAHHYHAHHYQLMADTA